MEKRRSKRKPVNLGATVYAEGMDCTGYIENICDHGFHLITASQRSKSFFIPEAILELQLDNAAGKKAKLHCEVRWVHINKTPIHGLTYRMGMEILRRPPEYIKIINHLK